MTNPFRFPSLYCMYDDYFFYEST